MGNVEKTLRRSRDQRGEPVLDQLAGENLSAGVTLKDRPARNKREGEGESRHLTDIRVVYSRER